MVELSLSFNITPTDFSFDITEAAASRILKLLELDGRNNQGLRIKVVPGGCAGFQYEFSWISLDKISEEKVISKNGASVVLGPSDLRYVNGSTLDFIEALSGSRFEVQNPNAASTCGCGKSFA